jgi:RNA polymerase sigma factor (sigma-70 family)
MSSGEQGDFTNNEPTSQSSSGSSITLTALISSLPEEERVILILHFVKNLTTAEIATKLGVPERSVKGVLSSGRSRLSAALNFPPT